MLPKYVWDFEDRMFRTIHEGEPLMDFEISRQGGIIVDSMGFMNNPNDFLTNLYLNEDRTFSVSFSSKDKRVFISYVIEFPGNTPYELKINSGPARAVYNLITFERIWWRLLTAFDNLCLHMIG